MQFTYPELLWALLLLLIPILVHLFQLRRFKKTPFTNVRLLKKVVAQSRHSRSLKKWLLLLTRLLLIAALVVAFAKPYLAAPEALTSRQQVIYLDNSFSMQAGSGEGSLIAQAIQDLLAAFPEETIFTLFTNDRVYEQVGIRDIRNELLALPQTYEQLDLGAVRLKGESLFSSTGEDIRDLILISDFQERMQDPAPDTLANLRTHYVQLMA